jgi:hypothetical protein
LILLTLFQEVCRKPSLFAYVKKGKKMKKLLILLVCLILTSVTALADDCVPCQADIKNDGFVFFSDLGILQLGFENGMEYYPKCCPTPVCTPFEGTLSALGRWCDQGDGTVKDMTTGLVWLKNASWGGAKEWEDYEVHDDAHTRVGILEEGTSGAGLSDGSLEGDWRLPTKTDLVGITVGDEGIRYDQMYFFTGVKTSYYWSGTSDGCPPSNVWVVGMHDDPMNSVCKYNYYSYYVWPVRSDN